MLLHIFYLIGITAEAMTGGLAAGTSPYGYFRRNYCDGDRTGRRFRCAIFCWAIIPARLG